MLGGHWFRGVETVGVELFGSLPRARALELVGVPFDLEEASSGGDRVRASVLAIHIQELSVLRLPLVRFDYPEVLWLLHLRPHGGTSCRVAIRAHTTPRMVPALSWFDRYDTERATIRIGAPDETLRVTTGSGALVADLQAGEDAEAPIIARLFTRAKGGVIHEIPWGPHAPERTRRLRVDLRDRALVDEVFGSSFEPSDGGLLYENRRHACSPAAALRGS